MALKNLFNTFKTSSTDSIVLSRLDKYLLKESMKPNDRAIDVNAPSQAGKCMRANYYSRTQAEEDAFSIDPRTQRIFDNGTHVHIRLQEYLADEGILLMDEVPLRNDEYNIQGHTDGILKVSPTEIAILEIKSINTNGFNSLKTAKEEHQKQAMVYLYCAEERRKQIRKSYKKPLDLVKSQKDRYKYYESLYKHIKGGSKHTREEKVKLQCDLHSRFDRILLSTSSPITKVAFLYEDKNTQDLKEFIVKRDETLIKEVLNEYATLNKCVLDKKVPEREGTTKNTPPCRWCNYKNQCFIV